MAPTFLKIQPSLPVTSIPDAIKYYTDVLGFRVRGRDRDDHTWLQLASTEDEDKDSPVVNIYLRRRTFPDIPNDVQFGKVYIRLAGADDELEQFFSKLEAKGAHISHKIVEKPWGLKDFEVKDLDGNILSFDQAIPGWKPPVRSGQQ